MSEDTLLWKQSNGRDESANDVKEMKLNKLFHSTSVFSVPSRYIYFLNLILNSQVAERGYLERISKIVVH